MDLGLGGMHLANLMPLANRSGVTKTARLLCKHERSGKVRFKAQQPGNYTNPPDLLGKKL